MSEGRSSPATLQEQRKPTRDHVTLLHEIVLRAQRDPLVSTSPKDALLNAYSATFEDHHLDVLQDSVCFWTLLKVIDPGNSSGSLYEKFENVLKDEGIELSFDDDLSQAGTGISTINSVSPVRIDVRHQRPQSHPPKSNITSPSLQSWQQHGLITSQPTIASQLGDDDSGYEEYMDNPPPQIMDLMRVAEAMDRKTLIRQSLAVLQPKGVAMIEAAADRMYTSKLKDRVIHQWHSVTLEHARDHALAGNHYEKRLKRKCLRRVLDAARIQHIKAMDEERLKGMALYRMTLATREAQFRSKIDARLKLKYLCRLSHAYHTGQLRQGQLDVILRQRQRALDARSLGPAMEAMMQAVRKIHVLGAMAVNFHGARLTSRTVTAWYDKTRSIIQAQAHADEARRKFLTQKYLRKLRDAASERRNRRTVLAKWVLCRWQNFVNTKKRDAYDIGYRQMRKMLKMNLARGLLVRWASQTRQIQEMEERADQIYAKKIRRTAHRSIVSMYERSQQILNFEKTAITNADRLALKHTMGTLTNKTDHIHQVTEVADRMHTLHDQQVAVQCLKHMSMKSFEIRRRERDAEAFRSRHDKRLARHAWEKMRIVAAQSRGEEPLHLPPATPAQRRAEEINRLTMTSTTPVYTPASRASFAARLRGANAATEIPSKITEEGDSSVLEEQ